MPKQESLLIIKSSEIEGLGLFANVDLKEDQYIGIAFRIEDDTGDPDNDIVRTKVGETVNHSSTPNLKLVQESNMYHFQAKRAISQGEELTFDYRLFPWDGERDFT